MFKRFTVDITLSAICLAGCTNVPQDKSLTNTVKVILTAKNTDDRLAEKQALTFHTGNAAVGETISIDETKTYQTIIGFGGSFTEAAAFTLSRMSPDKHTEAIKAYFDPKEGIGYTLCRTHINSCDFSLGNYAYTEVDGDTELKHFDIYRDKRWLIPMIKDAMKVPGADFEPDGDVDPADLEAFALEWLNCNNPQDTSCEPTW